MAETEYRRLSCGGCSRTIECADCRLPLIATSNAQKRCAECTQARRKVLLAVRDKAKAPRPYKPRKPPKIIRITKPCAQCGELMGPATEKQLAGRIHCSRKCLGLSQRAGAAWTCEECGVEFYRRKGGSETREGRDPRFCSYECTGKAQSKRATGKSKPLSPKAKAASQQRADATRAIKAAAKQQKVADKIARRRKCEEEAAAQRAARQCKACSATMGSNPWSRNCCTEQCDDDLRKRAKRRAKSLYRARMKAVDSERFLDVDIFRRDGWRCQICGVNTPQSRIGTNHPRAPTLDHIEAVANGGAHMRVNVQCACRMCNSKKRDGPPRGQMGLGAIWGAWY